MFWHFFEPFKAYETTESRNNLLNFPSLHFSFLSIQIRYNRQGMNRLYVFYSLRSVKVKALPCNRETRVWFPAWDLPLKKFCLLFKLSIFKLNIKLFCNQLQKWRHTTIRSDPRLCSQPYFCLHLENENLKNLATLCWLSRIFSRDGRFWD